MKTTNNYLNQLNEDFSFINKIFKGNLIAKVAKGVTNSIKGKTVNKAVLDKALKPIPAIAPKKIETFLEKHLPNFKHNKIIALKYFNKKYPTKQQTNDPLASATSIITAANDKYSIQDSIKRADKVYSYGGGGGGGAFVLILIGMFVAAGVFSIDVFTFKDKALGVILGALLIIVAFRSLTC